MQKTASLRVRLHLNIGFLEMEIWGQPQPRSSKVAVRKS